MENSKRNAGLHNGEVSTDYENEYLSFERFDYTADAMARALISSVARFWESQRYNEPEIINKLADKMHGERVEQAEAWVAYRNAYNQSADKHTLNDLWLHFIDESADVINCTVCAYMAHTIQYDTCVRKVAEILTDASYVDDSTFGVTHTRQYLTDMRYALEAAAIAKGKVTGLRVHALVRPHGWD